MEQFVAVATAHFVALLIPGVDFFLISRTALVSGRRSAVGVCAGIAAANGIFIAAAFGGLSLISHPTVLLGVQLAGGVFLAYIGVAFLRSSAHMSLTTGTRAAPTSGARSLALGLASGLMNPKNALFYVSLASVVAGAAPLVLVGYGVWMVAVVFVWDVLVAVALGSRRVLLRVGPAVPWLARAAGVFLVIFGVVMLVASARALVDGG